MPTELHAGVVLIGGGGHARVVAEALRLGGWQVAGHLAPQSGGVGDWLGADDALPRLIAQGHLVALGMGFVTAAGAACRATLLASIPTDALLSVYHPLAILSDQAVIGPGAALCAGCIVATDAQIGAGAIVNTGAIVDHSSCLGINSHAATGARLSGDVRVGRDVLIGAGAVVRQGITIGDAAIIGAGAVVIADVPPGAVMIGNPARPLTSRRAS